MLLWCRVNASGFVMLRAWYHFFFLKRFSSCTVTEKKGRREVDTYLWVLPCVHYLLCVLYALFLSVLMGVWTLTSLATVLVFCVLREK